MEFVAECLIMSHHLTGFPDTTMGKPSALERSLVVSVFPVPAGPAGAPPRWDGAFFLGSFCFLR